MRRRNYRNLMILGLGVFVAAFLFAFLKQSSGEMEARAADLSQFQAGYIISDYQMVDYNSMSEGEIQNFLWAKGNCYNTNFSGVGTRVDYFSDHTPPTTWHVSNGHTVCLAEENMNGESAAHIIWQAAQDFHINPKVLIVLIQKETGLITDPVPNSWDYQRTTGYGCPDTAACSEKYYGFKNQIRNAASLFRIVMDGNSSYYPIGNNYIQYNPNADCGGSNVYIHNLATSALYRYTPYQPNAGALAAGYGTAPCGAYGNRNFFSYYQDWFGGITTGYSVKLVVLNAFRDRYKAMTDALGEPASDINCGTGREGVCIQNYTEGLIAYSPNTGVIESFGEIGARYKQLGTVRGSLGLPVDTISCDEDGVCVQNFENGAIYHSSDTGTWESYGDMGKLYKQIGGAESNLGLPTSAIVCSVERADACRQTYENGTMTYSANTGAHENYGDMGARYEQAGGVSSALGLPTNEIVCGVERSDACKQTYEKGTMYYSESTGAYENYGDMGKRYKQIGEINGSLGLPTSAIVCSVERADACAQSYEKGMMLYSASTGAYENYGDVGARYKQIGGIKSALGLPTGAVVCSAERADACKQTYEKGTMLYSASTGAYENYGDMGARYKEIGGINGSLGLPTSAIICSSERADACKQTYEKGTMYYSASTGAYENYGDVNARYKQIGGINSKLGLPTGPIVCSVERADACRQSYEKGAIFYSASTGAWENYGKLVYEYVKLGAIISYLGLPVGEMQVNGDQETQNFEHGVLSL